MAYENAYQESKFCVQKKCKKKTTRKSSGFTGSTYADKEVTLDGDATENVAKLSYLGDVLSSGRRVQKAVTARIRCGWKMFKDIAMVPCQNLCHLS